MRIPSFRRRLGLLSVLFLTTICSSVSLFAAAGSTSQSHLSVIEIQNIEFAQDVSKAIEVQIPTQHENLGLMSVMVQMEGSRNYSYKIDQLSDSSRQLIFSDNKCKKEWFEVTPSDSGPVWSDLSSVQIPGMASILIPNRPDEEIKPGLWTFKIARCQKDEALKNDKKLLNIKMILKYSSNPSPLVGKIKINVYADENILKSLAAKKFADLNSFLKHIVRGVNKKFNGSKEFYSGSISDALSNGEMYERNGDFYFTKNSAAPVSVIKTPENWFKAELKNNAAIKIEVIEFDILKLPKDLISKVQLKDSEIVQGTNIQGPNVFLMSEHSMTAKDVPNLSVTGNSIGIPGFYNAPNSLASSVFIFVRDDAELNQIVHAWAHELGHYLGLEHLGEVGHYSPNPRNDIWGHSKMDENLNTMFRAQGVSDLNISGFSYNQFKMMLRHPSVTTLIPQDK